MKEILCRWGAVAEIVTDNGSAFVAALDYLAERYKINHIRISPYNSQAHGVVECGHFNTREAIIKACKGNVNRWPDHVSHAFLWTE